MATKKLMIIESPNKIKKLKQILGSDYDIKATVGHFRQLSKKGPFNLGVDDDFNPDFNINEDKYKIWNNIKTKIDDYQTIYIATDPDREGEAIGWHVYDCLPNNVKKKCVRVDFHEITKNAVLKAINNPRELNINLVKAQFLRQIGDKLIGYKGSKVVQRMANVKSTGRVQGVAVKLLVERENEINNYTPIYKQKFIPTIFDDNNIKSQLTHVDQEQNPIVYELSDQLPKIGKIFTNKDKITSKPTNTLPPKPFITSSILKKGIQCKLSAKQVQNSLQSLFEKGLITYPRTDSYDMSNDFFNELQSYVQNKYQNARDTKVIHKSKVSSQLAHECIRITHCDYDLTHPEISELDHNDQIIYQLIYENSLVNGMKDAISIKHTYLFDDELSNHFLVSSKYYTQRGFLDFIKDENQDEELLTFSLNTDYLGEVELNKFISNPKPSPYNEASLIAMLEKLEIGRPSTYASYVNILKDRDYATIDKKSVLTSTESGKLVYEVNEKYLKEFIDIPFTAKEFEPSCDLVEKGEITFNEVLKKWSSKLDTIMMKLENVPKINFNQNYEVTNDLCSHCQKCKKIKVKTKNDKFYYKCETSKFDPNTKTWTGCPIEWINDHQLEFKDQSSKLKQSIKNSYKFK